MKYIVGLLFVAVILVLGTLLKNDAPLLQEPGFVKRLAVYFTSHFAIRDREFIKAGRR